MPRDRPTVIILARVSTHPLTNPGGGEGVDGQAMLRPPSIRGEAAERGGSARGAVVELDEDRPGPTTQAHVAARTWRAPEMRGARDIFTLWMGEFQATPRVVRGSIDRSVNLPG
ncbi:hypothetical protein GCM10023094_34440 [Rhodococcus olei]|uniref:Uncharacterized protein n=1 Tax=Rhodococcus olei TaxID=2161675 RepID=A0ABP8P7L7_9NOCA